ncbi:hypothetical protein TNCV_2631371 [Trichonephila clavipes]|nr:hypothetical protein TNCV_2631371 [Trichonephila clavipes]
MEEKIALKVEEKIAVVEEKIEKKVGKEIGRIREQVEELGRIKEQFEEIGRIKEKIEERIDKVAGNFIPRFEDPEKKLLACWNIKNESKFVHVSSVSLPASPVPLTASPVSVKLSTYDGKINWEVYKTQFSIISEANGCTEGMKACQLAAFP